MPHVALIAMAGFRVREREMLALGMKLSCNDFRLLPAANVSKRNAAALALDLLRLSHPAKCWLQAPCAIS